MRAGRSVAARTLPAGLRDPSSATTHYVICYNTSRPYAQWCGSLLERLYMAFTNYWSRRGFALREPEFPLVALVFADAASYRDAVRGELKDAADDVIGYYSLETNRINMFDLTGSAGLHRPQGRHVTPAQINEILMQPDAERTVATIIHEATHQIAFNCGLQARFADVPLWVSEGLAVYFETPDLSAPPRAGTQHCGAGQCRAGWHQFRGYLAAATTQFSRNADHRRQALSRRQTSARRLC